ncbi:MAG: hypothetical protein WB816_08515 [Methylocystis sp.]
MSELTGNNSSQKEFQISLSMSGAISAGAYTAGVFDFLIEALETWEAARDRPEIPNHRVGLKAMSGASAGAITAVIGVLSLADDDSKKPGCYDEHERDGFIYRCTLPRLYKAWVVRPTFVAENRETNDFLTDSDLDPKKDWTGEADFSRTTNYPAVAPNAPRVVVSLLNARLLDEIARDAIDVKQVAKTPRAYVSKTLHIYLTLSNLRGVPYRVHFEGGDYFMIDHGDRAHYAVSGVGSWPKTSSFGEDDKPPRPISAKDLSGDHAARANWKDFSICALASSAYPVGLAPRLIGATQEEYLKRRFPIADLADDDSIDANWPRATTPTTVATPTTPITPATVAPPTTPYCFVCADGGIIDNDPFEYAHFALKEGGKLKDPIECAPREVDRAVIMITPFPEEKPILPEGQPGMDIVSLFSALMPSLIDQARFKPDELALAANKEHASRYLIGPSRDVNNVPQRYGIASGLLGGFGGFIHRDFRDHDYQLGRRNCQQFLRTSFAVPEGHDIVASWPATVKLAEHQVPRTADDDAQHRPNYYRLIPLIGPLADEIKLPPWPQINKVAFDQLQKRIATRFDKVAPALVAQKVKGFLGLMIRLVLIWGINRIPGLIRARALEYARRAILSDLVRRDQISDWTLPENLDLPNDDVRLILAELINPAYDYRTVDGILRSISPSASRAIEPVQVRALLLKLKHADGKPLQTWQAPDDWAERYRTELFTLASQAPNPVTGGISAWFAVGLGIDFFKPTFDPD